MQMATSSQLELLHECHLWVQVWKQNTNVN